MQGSPSSDGFRVCRNCGYTRGFHVYFKEAGDGKIDIGLICPSCGQSYEIGWRSEFSELQIRQGKKFDE